MIELFEKDIIKTENKSSKGNQLKWRKGDYWYKADYTGYEGLSEVIASRMLEKSSLSRDEYVYYYTEEIQYKSGTHRGCRSSNFLDNGQQLITLERLYNNFCGKSLYRSIFSLENYEDRFAFLCSQVERITGIKNFAGYMNKILTIDAITLNEDRHLHNIAVILNEDGKYETCPIFDQGAGFLADTTMEYPMNQDVYSLIDSVKSKTICDDFDEQLDISERLSGNRLDFHFTKKNLQEWLEEDDVVAMYDEQIRNRVYNIAVDRMRRYG